MSDEKMKSSSSVDDPFFENSTTSGSQDQDTSEAMSVFTGSVVFGDGDIDEADQEMDQEEELVAKEHSEAVARLKIVVLTVLCVSVIGMSLAVYFYASRVEYSKFEEGFSSDSLQIYDAVKSALVLKISVVDAFLTDLDAFSALANDSWPYVTTPVFAARASQALLMSNSAKLNQFQFVDHGSRLLWEEYAATNDAWVAESIQFQSDNAPWNSTVPKKLETSSVIIGVDGSDIEAAWYLPLWQNFPLDDNLPSYNLDGAVIPVLQASLPFLANHTVVISGIVDSTDEVNAQTGPASEVQAPIFTDISSPTLNGVLSLKFYWKEMLKGILPSGNGAISVIIANECNESFSYKLDDDDVSFLGFGSIYDEKYRYLEENYTFFGVDELSSPNGLPISGNCTYWMKIYPTESKEQAYQTSNPAILASASLIIFLFTAAHFTLYDYVVEFKNQEVLKSGE